MEQRQIIRAALAMSIVAHLVLTFGFMLADARPFEDAPSEAIAVDIVAPDDVPQPAKETPPAPEPPKPPDPFQLPKPSLTDQKPQQENQQQTAKQPAPQQSAAKPPAPPPATQKMSTPAKQQPSQQAAMQPSSSPNQPPPPEQPQSAQPESSPQSAPPPGAPEPDITVKYGVMLGLPNGDGGASAFSMAEIAPVDTAAFRRHLKSCSVLPASVAPADKVRIVLRAFLQPDGRLVGAPGLIEASASAKGPALMKAAIDALQTCQPYTMLPADKYNEWKVLDLSFTPQDFSGN